MKNKIYVIVFMVALLMGIVSAEIFTFDNGLLYEEDDMKVTITTRDFFGIGDVLGIDEKLGELTLTSHSTPTEIKYVIAGNNRTVMYYDFKDWELYKNGLGEVTFTDGKTSLEIDKDYYFAEAIYEDVEIPTYKEVCNGVINKNNSKEFFACSNVVNGSKLESQLKEWRKLETNDIPNYDIRIGLVTDVNKDDYVDGIWEVAGKEISRHGFWQDSYGINLFSYYNFSSLVDPISDYDLTVGAGTPVLVNNATCKSGFAGCGFVDGSSKWTIPDNNKIDFVDNDYNLTLNLWIRIYAISGSDYMYGKSGTSALWVDGTNIASGTWSSSTMIIAHGGATDRWMMLTVTRNSSHTCLYVNGTNIDPSCQTRGTGGATGGDLGIGGNHDGTTFEGYMDEMGMWDRPLTETEIDELYDSGTGTSRDNKLVDTINPDINITYPINNSMDANLTLYIEYIASDDVGLDTCWYSNGTYQVNTTLATCGTNITGLIFEEGIYNFTIWANDTFNNVNHSQVIWTAIIPPTLSIDYPINETLFSKNNVDVNYSVSDAGLDSCWWSNSSGNLNNSIVCGQNITNMIWIDGIRNITIWANDSLNNEIFDEISFTVDTSFPQINLTSPIDLQFAYLGLNISVNWTVTEAGTLGSCWFDHNGTVQDVVCGDNNYTFTIETYENRNLTFYANDTIANENSSFIEWDYKIFQNDVTFSNLTTEGANEVFILNFTQGTGFQTSTVDFVYNTSINSAPYIISSNEVISTMPFTIPNVPEASVVYFYWQISMTDGTKSNTTTYNQTVNSFQMDNCSTFGNLIYNYTILDEETQVPLENISVEVSLNLYDSDKTSSIINFSQLYDNINPVQICINSSLLTTINYTVDSTVKYYSNDTDLGESAIEYYNILGGILSNYSVPNRINLYSLLLVDSTEFQLTFRDSSFSLIPNVLVNLYRQYVSDNDFKIVEAPLTDSNGQTVLHMVRNDVVYNIVMVSSNGSTIGVFNKVIAFCQDFTIGSCTIVLNAFGGAEDTYDYDDDFGISYSIPTYSNVTDELSFSFTSLDLSSKNITMEVIRNSDFGNRSVCEESLTSATGTLTCNVSSVSSENRFLFTNIYVDGKKGLMFTTDLEYESRNFGKVNGAFFAFLIILFLITVFMEDKQVLIVSLGLGWTIVISIGLLNGTIIGTLSGGIWLLICLIIFLWKLKKEVKI